MSPSPRQWECQLSAAKGRLGRFTNAKEYTSHQKGQSPQLLLFPYVTRESLRIHVSSGFNKLEALDLYRPFVFLPNDYPNTYVEGNPDP